MAANSVDTTLRVILSGQATQLIASLNQAKAFFESPTEEADAAPPPAEPGDAVTSGQRDVPPELSGDAVSAET